jgi:putative membrane protein
MAMGAANVIPGVSGGTIAFITGIYERLIHSIKSFDLKSLKLLLKGRIKDFLVATDAEFLIYVLSGIVVSILSLAKVLELAFEHYEVLTLSFFFGLIIASVWAVSKQIDAWGTGVVVALLLGTVIAVLIAFLPPAQSNDNTLYVFICGIVAVCSMILPGLSGSYLLLLMGNYLLVLKAISAFNFSILIPLILGCVIGLVLFSRLLSYLFKHFKDLTIALLSGFVTGSLLIIWPWKQTIFENFEEKEKAIGYVWNLPKMDVNLLFASVLILAGFFLVWLIETKASQTN